jgi:transposase InsO family protein
MDTQKQEILEFVDRQRKEGRKVGEILETISLPRATYYRWRQKTKEGMKREAKKNPRHLTPLEIGHIDRIKEEHPELRHRQLQGKLQAKGILLSATSIYRRLKSQGLVEPYARREAPWKEPRYEIWQRNLVWGCDWTKLRIAGLRWYLLTLIDFFSRFLIAWDIVPSVNASCVKKLYREGLRLQKIPLNAEIKPEMRADCGSPNTSWVTKDFFEILGAELSYARVRRPTDNAITERFYGTIKQEEIYVVGDYPDKRSGHEEIGSYIEYYNHVRPHQALWNFTPAWVHEINNKTEVMKYREQLKQQTLEKRKMYWIKQQSSDLQKISDLSH